MQQAEDRVKSEEPTRAPPRGARALWVARILVPVAAIAILLRTVPLGHVLASVRSMPASALLEATAVIAVATALATLRWRMLFHAAGLNAVPRFAELLRIYWIGTFYNTFVPGGLGGDVVRAIATRRVAGPSGLPAALAIVLLERTLGFVGLLIVVAVGFAFFPLERLSNIALLGSIGLAVASTLVAVIVYGRRIARYLPARLGRVFDALPDVVSLPLLLAALGLSVVNQLSGVVVGHVLISSIAGDVTWKDSLLILPLVAAAQYFPFTIGGAGVREAGFVVLYGMIGVKRADSLAASLVLATLQYALSAIGGVLHALHPLELESPLSGPDSVQSERESSWSRTSR